MPRNTKISNAAAIVMLDVIIDLLDAGAGQAKVRIYAGTQPTGVDTPVGAQVLLADLTFNATAFGNAVNANPGAIATAAAITSANAVATDDAAWFRALDSNDLAVVDGSVGETDADMILSSVSIVSGQPVDITAWTITQPES